jgi:regulator of sirC expression with transglutaminase-like and TPR domain
MEGVRARFAELAGLPDEAIDLAEGALLIAAEAAPSLDVAHYLSELDALAEEARPKLVGATSGAGRVVRLNEFLFEEKRFYGNVTAYRDVRNSFLNEVLERRTGIPITLSIVYMEVARRLGLRVEGVGFPGHFLCKHVDENEIVIDAFYGQILSEEDCAERLREVMGTDARFDRHYLAAARKKEILARILRNLKQLYVDAHEYECALACSERILLLLPDEPLELRDRGLLYEQLECFGPALADLERFLELVGDRGPAAEAVRPRLERIRRQVAQIH